MLSKVIVTGGFAITGTWPVRSELSNRHARERKI